MDRRRLASKLAARRQRRSLRPCLTHLGLALLLAIPSLASELPEEVGFDVLGSRKAILVDVTVNGRAIEMVVDTGATRSIIRPETLGWGLAQLRRAEFQRQGPGLRGQGTWEVVDLRLGSRVWHRFPIVVMDLTAVQEVFGERVEGILGQDVLTSFTSVEFDFAARQLRLRP